MKELHHTVIAFTEWKQDMNTESIYQIRTIAINVRLVFAVIKLQNLLNKKQILYFEWEHEKSGRQLTK